MLQRAYPEFVLCGKIDRLDELADGTLEVIDYKSGRLTVTEAEVRASLPLAIYQLLTARAFPDRPVRAAIYCLRTGKRAAILRDAVELAAVEAGIRRMILTLLQDQEKRPAPGPACHGCPFTLRCPEGRHYLAKTAASTAAGA